jgi:hypothetical protein
MSKETLFMGSLQAAGAGFGGTGRGRSCSAPFLLLLGDCRGKRGSFGRSLDTKTPVFGMVERGGRVIAKEAEVVGVDINPWCLKQCTRKNHSGQLSFFHSLSREFADSAGFDAIFCMAVFQRTAHRTENAQPGDTGFTFERFEAEVAMLDRKLKPDGLFFLDECDFSFEQTAAAARYRPAEFDDNRALRQRPLFDRENRLIANESYSLRCFIKQGG